MDAPVYAKAIHLARQLFDFADKIGYRFTLLDIGGGFPGDKNSDITEVQKSIFYMSYFVNFQCLAPILMNDLHFQIAKIVNHSIDLHFPSPDVDIIAEPGRFYVASAFTLFCTVHSKRELRRNDKLIMMYYINDGVYGSFNPDHKEIHPVTLKSSDEQVFKSKIWGPTCAALDLVIN